jgi:hypothetical protein
MITKPTSSMCIIPISNTNNIFPHF